MSIWVVERKYINSEEWEPVFAEDSNRPMSRETAERYVHVFTDNPSGNLYRAFEYVRKQPQS